MVVVVVREGGWEQRGEKTGSERVSSRDRQTDWKLGELCSSPP